VLGGYLILLITVSSVPDLQKKNGSESQRKSVSAVLKGKNIRGKKKQNKTKEGENLRTARSRHFRLTSFGQVFNIFLITVSSGEKKEEGENLRTAHCGHFRLTSFGRVFYFYDNRHF